VAKEFVVMSRVLIICALTVSVAIPLSARQAAQGPGASGIPAVASPAAAQTSGQSPAESLREQRVQLGNFEVLLHAALRGAVQKFGQWVLQVAPSVYVTQAANPAVHGFPLPDGDLVFTVQQAELVGWQFLTLQLQQPAGRPASRNPAPPGTVVSQGAGPGGGIVKADPMNGPAVAPTPAAEEGCARVTPGPIDPNQKYSECVKEALIDAMLDNSRMLPLKPGQTLQLVDIPIDSAVQNQVYSSQSRKLILSIQGDDLKAFHDGKITRDEAKQRIVEKRF
jgi:hypothetical protein